MSQKLAIDFGTTNTLIARQNGDGTEIIHLPGMSHPETGLIPSLVYVQDNGQIICGQKVRDQGYDHKNDSRLFRNFKRGIVTTSPPKPRQIEEKSWGDREAGTAFLKHLLDNLNGTLSGTDHLVLTAPVVSFESYLSWLSGLLENANTESIRVVDESTAAALGYALTEPKALVLVFDFGGGTLDLSLVQLPEKAGGLLARFRDANRQTAKVIAKAGHVIGGSDIDQWILAKILERAGITSVDLGAGYSALLTKCEAAKIALSTQTETTVRFSAGGDDHEIQLTRDELESLLEHNGFYHALRRLIDKIMQVARQRGIFKEDIHHVLMIGGTSLMPSVQETLRNYFGETSVRMEHPFTAVVEGALQIAAGHGLDDHLIHSYGIRYLDDENGQHRYEEIIPAGAGYPTKKPFEITLEAAHPGQAEMEFIIGEIETDSMAMVEIAYENGQAVFVARPDQNATHITPLNADSPLIVPLNPKGKPGDDRIKASFSIDRQRQLRLTITDLKTRKKLIKDAPLAALN